MVVDKVLYRETATTQANLEEFVKVQVEFNVAPVEDRDKLVWRYVKSPVARLRNSLLGTLLLDLSSGKSLDASVTAYESKAAPANYKRPKALITTAMIKDATRKIAELGIEDSLHRRLAVQEM